MVVALGGMATVSAAAIGLVNSLVLQQQPSGGTGGMPFAIQPVVSALDSAGGLVTALDSTVSVRATVQSHGTGSRFLAVGGSLAAPFVSGTGFANFSGLLVTEAPSHNVTLRFELELAAGTVSPWVVSAQLSITVGPAVRVALRRQPGAAEGGRPFRAQPIVEVQDAGGNRVQSDNATQVTAVLVNASGGVLSGSGSAGSAPLTMVQGSVTFRDLSIDTAGTGYAVRFVTTASATHAGLVSDSAANVTSDPLTVGIGPTAAMRFAVEAAGARGGHAFTTQPVVELVDAGGNVNVQDNHSFVTVSILDDPTPPGVTAVLSPTFFYHEYSLTEVTATVDTGSAFVTLGGSVPALQLSPPLEHGDRVAIAAGTHHYPERGALGAAVRLVHADGENRLRLQDPWAGPALVGQRLLRQTHAHTVRVVQGRAAFTNLTLDRAAAGYRLVFVSSLRPDPAGTLLGFGRPGFGRVGYGFGYGVDLHDRLAAHPNEFSPPYDLNRQDSGPVYLASSVEAATSGLAAPYPSVPAPPNITLATAPFSVLLGDPHHIHVDVPAAGAWAGGQPCLQQPVVSLRDAGGNLLAWDNSTNVTVALTADPTGSPVPALAGFTWATMAQGRAEFLNLAILREGVGFELTFAAAVPGWGTFTVTHNVTVLTSAEWEVGLPDAQPGDSLGGSVAVAGDVLVAGAPYDRAPEKEVQVVETAGDADALLPEIQAIGTAADSRVEVQTILLETVSNVPQLAALDPLAPSTPWQLGARGSFRVRWGGRVTAAIDVTDAHAALVQVVLEQELDKAGSGPLRVSESRSSALVGGGTATRQTTAWAVTFAARNQGPVEVMTVDSSAVTPAPFSLSPAQLGNGTSTAPSIGAATASAVVQAVQTTAASVLGGSFSLSVDSGLGATLHTPQLPHDASPYAMKTAIETFLLTGPVQVSRRNVAPSATYPNAGPTPTVGGLGGFVWSVTFTPTASTYDPPTLGTNASQMTGVNPRVWAAEVRRGRAPLGGSFSLYFRNQGPSPAVPVDASSDELQQALQALPSVVEVAVTRSGPSSSGGYRWTVTFERTANSSVAWNSFVDDTGDSHFLNLPPLGGDTDGVAAVAMPFPGFIALPNSAPSGVLSGSGARVLVTHIYDHPTAQPWYGAVQARPGRAAGSVVVAEREWRSWRVEPGRGVGAHLKAADAGAQDQFGWAVAVDSAGSIVVGAPGAEARGVLEQQRLRCRADGGTLTLAWRGHSTSTAPLYAANATAADLKAALQALPTLHEVNVAVDTSLVAGGALLSAEQAAALPICAAVDTPTELVGRATIITIVWPQDGDMEPIEADGSALNLSSSGQNLTGAASALVAVEDDYVRGTRKSSGFNATGEAAGAAYIFQPDAEAQAAQTGNQWKQVARLEAPAETRKPGDMYGAAVSVSGDVAVVGAPQDDGAGLAPMRGAVYVYIHVGDGVSSIGGRAVEKTPESGAWGLLQRLVATTTNSNGAANALFGAAVAVSGHTLAVGAPGMDGGRGRVLVFKRLLQRSQSFLIDQTLAPPSSSLLEASSSVLLLPAGFGTSVDVGDDLLIVGAPGAKHPDRRARSDSTALDPLINEEATGCAFVYDRPGFGEFFQGNNLSATTAAGAPRAVLAPTPARSGDRFGIAVAISGHVAVVAGVERTLATPTHRQEVQAISSGVVRVRADAVGFLDSPAINAGLAAAGVHVLTGGSNRTAQVGGHFAVQWRRRQVLASWRTPQAVGGTGLGGTRLPSPLVWRPFETRRLPADASARDVKRALEEDLGTGRVNVTRQGPAADGGYRWLVTFSAIDDDLAPQEVPLLAVRTDALTPRAGRPAAASEVAAAGAAGLRAPPALDQATMAVHRVSSAPDPVRGQAVVFRREAPAREGSWSALAGVGASGFGSQWWEEAALVPYAHQRADRFGSSVALDGNTAVVGAPNRDQHNSGVNAGAALAFDLGLLNARIEGASAPEGGTALAEAGEGEGGRTMHVTHCGGAGAWQCVVPDRPASAPGAAAALVAHVHVVSGSDWGAYDGPTARPVGGAGAAASSGVAADAWRAPALGPPFCLEDSEQTDDCAFLRLGDRFGLAVLTAYDYAAVSDFAPVHGRPAALARPGSADVGRQLPLPELPVRSASGSGDHPSVFALQRVSNVTVGNSSSVRVVITDDDVFEAPDETLHVRLSLPGIQPLFPGHLWAPLAILDDGDGTAADTAYAQRLTAAEDGGDGDGSVSVSQPLDSQPLPPANARLGTSVALRGVVAISGAPMHDGSAPSSSPPGSATVAQVGRAVLMRQSSGIWAVEQVLAPPEAGNVRGARFGAGVALSPGADVAAVTASGAGGAQTAIALHVFRAPSASGAGAWALEASLHPQLAEGREGGPVLPADAFGLSGAVAITQSPSTLQAAAGAAPAGASLVVAVGCPGKEAVFLFRSAQVASSSRAHIWRQTAVLRSSAWRPLRWLETWHMVPEQFGAAVAASHGPAGSGQLVVGAPIANHGFVPPPSSFQDILQYSASVPWRATGAVYVFQLVEGIGNASLPPPGASGGSASSWTAAASWPGGDDAEATTGNTVSAHHRGMQPGLVRIPGSATYDSGLNSTAAGAAVASPAVEGVWAEHARLVPATARNAERVGASVAVDGSLVVAGAPASPAQPRTSWDFESGDLSGWVRTGSAFDFQPTMGDNPAHRHSYSTPLGLGQPQPSRLRGRYFVGTFERRQGNTTAIAGGDPSQPAPVSSLAGTVQGDTPTGTLTSDPFLVAGRFVSFLIGGGCDERKVFVSLLVDGLMFRRATGSCSEEMQRVQWDVARLIGRAAQIRISDLSADSPWGHINVDDFRFAWDIGRYTGTPRAGAAYVYRRFAGGATLEPCAADAAGGAAVLSCGWEQQARFTASDKRRAAAFGSAVAVDEATGVAAVSALGHSPVHPDWAMPGTTAGVLPGPFGAVEGSLRGDAGLNALAPHRAHGWGQWVRPGDVVSAVGVPGGVGSTLVPGEASAPPRPYQQTTGVAGPPAGNLWAGAVDALGVSGASQMSAGPLDTLGTPLVTAGGGGGAAFGASPLGAGQGLGFLSPWFGNVGSSRGGLGYNGLSLLDAAGGSGLLGGSGPNSGSGRRFDTHGADSLSLLDPGSAGARGPFDPMVSPFDYQLDGLSASGRLRSGASSMAVAEAILRRGMTEGRWLETGGTARHYHPALAAAGASTAPAMAGAHPAGGAGASTGAGLGRAAPEGVLYLFRRDPERRGGEPQTRLLRRPEWRETQHLSPRLPWAHPGMQLGAAVSLDGDRLAAGAPRDSRESPSCGSVAVLDVSAVRAGFESADFAEARSPGRDMDTQHQEHVVAAVGSTVDAYAFPENFHLGYAVVPVFRGGARHGGGTGDLSGTLRLRYATQGVTAQGITARKRAACLLLPKTDRSKARCGDYVDVAGLLTFGPGVTRQDVVIPLIDDDCYEPEGELFLLRLGLPGGVGLIGEEFSVTVRIDDDDASVGGATCLRPLEGD